MALFTPMKFYCTACGNEVTVKVIHAMGREWKTCSLECLMEMEVRSASSTLGVEYEKWSKK